MGSDNSLPYGSVQALRGLRHRVPEDCPEPLADLADDALVTIARVLRAEIPSDMATPMLKAAAMAREEVCGKQAQPLTGANGAPLDISISIIRNVKGEPDAK